VAGNWPQNQVRAAERNAMNCPATIPIRNTIEKRTVGLDLYPRVRSSSLVALFLANLQLNILGIEVPKCLRRFWHGDP
jgi:hypothetical protein